jgi:hypothetical protein
MACQVSIQGTDLEARLERLERQNRRLRLAVLGVVILAGATLLMGQARKGSRTLEAEAFVLRDLHGKVRGSFKLDQSGRVALDLLAPNGKPRARLALVHGEYPRFELWDKKDRRRAALTSYPSDFHGLSLYGKGKKPRMSIYLDANDVPRLSMMDSKNLKRLGLGVLQDDTPHISLRDRKKRTVASLYVNPQQAPRLELFQGMQATVRIAVEPRGGSKGLVLYGAKGRPAAGFGIDSSSRASLQFFDARGKTTFKAPHPTSRPSRKRSKSR